MPTNTTNFGLIKPGQEEFYDVNVPNVNMDVIDSVLKEIQDESISSKVKNLGFRGLLADPVYGIGGPDHINKYPEGLSVLYTDMTDWAVFLNITDFVGALEFLFVETNKTIQDGKINATQQITRYKKESTATPVKLISQYKRVWYSDATYTGWSNAEKLVFEKEFTTHLADDTNPHKVTKSQVGLGNVGNYGVATTLESETGESDIKYMTPLKVKQAVTKFTPKNVPNGFVGIGSDGKILESVIPNTVEKYVKIANIDFLANSAASANVSNLSAYKKIRIKLISTKTSITSNVVVQIMYNGITGTGLYTGSTTSGTISNTTISLAVTTTSPIITAEIEVDNQDEYYLSTIKSYNETPGGVSGGKSMGIVSLKDKQAVPLNTLDFSISGSSNIFNGGKIEVWGVAR